MAFASSEQERFTCLSKLLSEDIISSFLVTALHWYFLDLALVVFFGTLKLATGSLTQIRNDLAQTHR